MITTSKATMLPLHNLYALGVGLLSTTFFCKCDAAATSNNNNNLDRVYADNYRQQTNNGDNMLKGMNHPRRNRRRYLSSLLSSPSGFSGLNEILEEMTFTIPSFEATENIGIFPLTLSVSNTRCHSVVLDDVQTKYNVESDQRITFEVEIRDIGIECDFDFSWSFSFLSDGGEGIFMVKDTYANTLLAFDSEDFNQFSPRSSTTEHCDVTVVIDDLIFKGGVTAAILWALETLIRSNMDKSISGLVCNILSPLISDFVEEMMGVVDDLVVSYEQPLEEWRLDPTYLEQSVVTPKDVDLINYNDPSGVGLLSVLVAEEANLYFATMFDLPINSTAGPELGINMFLRDYILAEDGSFIINGTHVPMSDLEMIDIHTEFAEYKFTLNSIKIYGFDSFTRFEVIDVSKYTYKADVHWDFLSFEVNTTVDIKQSSLPGENGFMQIEDPFILSEDINFNGVVSDVDAVVAMLLAFDQKKLEPIQVGSLLVSENIVPCIFSALHDTGLSEFRVSVGDITELSITGMIEPGVDRIVTTSVDAVLSMYEPAILRVMPNYFQTTVRDLFSIKLKDFAATATCVSQEIEDEFLDYRDLFLDVEGSESFGGSGDGPYGDVPVILHDFVRTMLSSADEFGLIQVNSLIIGPLTQVQSGVKGMVRFEEDLIVIKNEDLLNHLFYGFELKVSDLRIRNLDTVTAPVDIWQLTDSPYILANEITLGPEPGRRINVTFTIELILGENGSPLDIFDKMDLSMSSDSITLLFEVFSKISSRKLQRFPIGDAYNVHCWLAMLAPAMDEYGERVTDESDQISLKSFNTSITGLSFDLHCSTNNCTSTGFEVFPELVQILEESGTLEVLANRYESLAEEVMMSDQAQEAINEIVEVAAKFCPHSPQYDSKSDARLFDLGLDDIPPLSKEALDTILLTAANTLQVLYILLIKTQQSVPMYQEDIMSVQREFFFSSPRGVQILDWTTFRDTPPIFRLLFSEGQNYLRASDHGRNLADVLDNFLSESLDFDSGYTFLDGDSSISDHYDHNKVNELVARFFESDGYFSVPIDYLNFESAGFMFKIDSLRVAGLDSFIHINMLDAISPQILNNSFHLETISIEIDISVDSLWTPDPPQSVRLSLRADDVNLTVPLFVAIEIDKLNNLQIGSLLRIQDIPFCFLSAAHDAHIIQMLVTAGEFFEPTIVGLMQETDIISKSFTNIAFNNFYERIESSFTSFFQNSLRPLLNSVLKSYIADPVCKNLLLPENQINIDSSEDYVDFRDLLLSEEVAEAYGGSGKSPYGEVFRMAFDVLTNVILQIDENTGLSAINEIMVGQVTRAQSGETGTLFYPRFDISHGINFTTEEAEVRFGFRISDLRIRNVDYIGEPLSVVDPMVFEPHKLNNTVAMGVGGVPLSLSIRLAIDMSQTDDAHISNEVEIIIDMYSLTVMLTILANVVKEKFAKLPLRDIFNLYCWLATVPARTLDEHGVAVEGTDKNAELLHLSASVARMNLQLNCVSCSSPKMEEFVDTLNNQTVQSEFTNFTNEILRYTTGLVGGKYLQVEIDRMLKIAESKCPSNDLLSDHEDFIYDPFDSKDVTQSISYIVLFTALTGCLAVIVAIGVLVVQMIVRKRHQQWLLSLPKQKLYLLLEEQRRDKETEDELNIKTRSMFKSDAIPIFSRYFVPLVIIGNIGFFLSGHFSKGGAVDVTGHVGGQKIHIENFFEFSIAQSTLELFKGGAIEMAMVVLVFSVIWPYTKQFITLALWFLPPHLVSISRRGSIFFWLDVLAKWSFMDIFALVVSLVSFRTKLFSPQASFLPNDLYYIHLMVVPKWGLYANMIAQVISQINSHFIIHYHRRIIKNATKSMEQIDCEEESEIFEEYGQHIEPEITKSLEEEEELEVKCEVSGGRSQFSSLTGSSSPYADSENEEKEEQLFSHKFSRPHRGELDQLVIRSFVNPLVAFTAVFVSLLFITGCIFPSHSLEILGIFGIALEAGQNFNQAVTNYSVFSLVGLLMDQARYMETTAAYVGLGTLSALTILVVLVVPLAQTITLVCLWFYPMIAKTRAKLTLFVEILQAWQYSEVYILSVVIASWQMGPTSDVMINQNCESLSDTISALEFYGILDSRDAQCFKIEANISTATYLIFVSAILLALLTTFVTKAVAQYFRDKDAPRKVSVLFVPPEEFRSDVDEDEVGNSSEVIRGVRPVPALFADAFRWLLVHKDRGDREEANDWTTRCSSSLSAKEPSQMTK